MTDAEVIAAIRRNHLKANIDHVPEADQQWDLAWVDPGGTLFGPGPYVKLPVMHPDYLCVVPIRVYPPERLRRRLARDWKPAVPPGATEE
jgi:hypothetical protein